MSSVVAPAHLRRVPPIMTMIPSKPSLRRNGVPPTTGRNRRSSGDPGSLGYWWSPRRVLWFSTLSVSTYGTRNCACLAWNMGPSSSSLPPSSSSSSFFSTKTLSPRKDRSSRYYTKEHMIDPLSPIQGPVNQRFRRKTSIIYTNDPSRVGQWIAENVRVEGCTLGFDTESIPTAPWCQVPRRCHRGSPTTIQLATLESVLVVHLVKPGGKPSEACAPMIDAILRDENIIKAGCGVDQDIMALHRLWPGLEATSRFDLASLFQTDKGYTPGLATLTERVVGLELPKPRKVQMSNWGQVPLDKRQIVYAGRDAWAGAAIAAVLESNDPELFSPEPLKNALKRQVTIGDLNQKWEQRQRGKKVKRAKQTFICVPIQLPVASASPPAEMSSPPPAGMNSAPVMTPPSLPTLNLDEAFPLRQLSIGKGTVRKQRKD